MSRFSRLALDTETPRRMTIMHPATRRPMADSSGAPAYLDVLSLTGPAAQKARATIQQDRIDRRVRQITVEDTDRDAMVILAACITGWHLVGWDGEPLGVPYSQDAAKELLTDPAMRWLADQASVFADAAGNFLPASSRS